MKITYSDLKTDNKSRKKKTKNKKNNKHTKTHKNKSLRNKYKKKSKPKPFSNPIYMYRYYNDIGL